MTMTVQRVNGYTNAFAYQRNNQMKGITPQYQKTDLNGMNKDEVSFGKLNVNSGKIKSILGRTAAFIFAMPLMGIGLISIMFSCAPALDDEARADCFEHAAELEHWKQERAREKCDKDWPLPESRAKEVLIQLGLLAVGGSTLFPGIGLFSYAVNGTEEEKNKEGNKKTDKIENV